MTRSQLLLLSLIFAAAPANPSESLDAISGRGRLEGSTRPLQLGFERGGVVSRVRVEAGQVVSAGELLAELTCDTEVAVIRGSEAEAAAAKAAADRAHAGPRQEERAIAEAVVDFARAGLAAASARAERLARLSLSGDLVPSGDLEDALRQRDVAAAALEVEVRRLALASRPARQEDVEAATQLLASAEARARSARAQRAKCSLRAPAAGVVLRRDVEIGDVLDPLRPRAIIQLADTSRWAARVELDEGDAHRVRVGMKAEIRIAAAPEIKFKGTLVRAELMVGPRSIRSAQALERTDRPVRVVYVALESCRSPACVVGLEVDVVLTSR